MLTSLQLISSEGSFPQQMRSCPKIAKAQSVALTILGLVLISFSIVQLSLLTPLTYAIGLAIAATLALTSLLCFVLAFLSCMRKEPKKLDEATLPDDTASLETIPSFSDDKESWLPTFISKPDPSSIPIEKTEDDETLSFITVSTPTPTPPISRQPSEDLVEDFELVEPMGGVGRSLIKYLNPSINISQLYESKFFSSAKKIECSLDFMKLIQQSVADVFSGVATLYARCLEDKDVISLSEVGTLFLHKIHHWKTNPLSKIITGAQSLFSSSTSGTAWLCAALRQPKLFEELSYCLSCITTWHVEKLDAGLSMQGLLSCGSLMNSFLCGWTMPTSMARANVLLALNNLSLPPKDCREIVEALDSGNVLGALVMAYRSQNLPFSTNENTLAQDGFSLWSPRYYCSTFEAQANPECLLQVTQVTKQFSAACPSSLLSLLSSGKNLSILQTAFNGVWNAHADFIITAPGTLSVLIAVLSEAYKNPDLQRKLKSLLPSGTAAPLGNFLSCLFLGAQTTGLLTEEHLLALSESLLCPVSAVQTMINEQILIPTLLEKML